MSQAAQLSTPGSLRSVHATHVHAGMAGGAGGGEGVQYSPCAVARTVMPSGGMGTAASITGDGPPHAAHAAGPVFSSVHAGQVHWVIAELTAVARAPGSGAGGFVAAIRCGAAGGPGSAAGLAIATGGASGLGVPHISHEEPPGLTKVQAPHVQVLHGSAACGGGVSMLIGGSMPIGTEGTATSACVGSMVPPLRVPHISQFVEEDLLEKEHEAQGHSDAVMLKLRK